MSIKIGRLYPIPPVRSFYIVFYQESKTMLRSTKHSQAPLKIDPSE
jgi:hypothetical protein